MQSSKPTDECECMHSNLALGSGKRKAPEKNSASED